MSLKHNSFRNVKHISIFHVPALVRKIYSELDITKPNIICRWIFFKAAELWALRERIYTHIFPHPFNLNLIHTICTNAVHNYFQVLIVV